MPDPVAAMAPDHPALAALAAAFADVPRPDPLVGRKGSYAHDEADAFDAIEDWENVTPETLFDAHEGLIIMGPETAHFVLPHLLRMVCLHRARNEAADNFLGFVETWLTGASRWDLVPRLTGAERAALIDVLGEMDRLFYAPSGSDFAGAVAGIFAEIAQNPTPAR